MILVGQYDSFPTRRVGIALHHYGISFQRDTRSIFGDAAEIAKINPLIRIPALVLDDGEVLIDSNAILDTLDEWVGEDRALVPRAGAGRRKVMQVVALAQGIGEKAAAVIYERFLHTPAQRSQSWERRSIEVAAAGLDVLEERAGAQWLCGDTLSHADIAAFCTIAYLRLRVPEVLDRVSIPRLTALSARCANLAAVQACPIAANEMMPDPA